MSTQVTETLEEYVGIAIDELNHQWSYNQIEALVPGAFWQCWMGGVPVEVFAAAFLDKVQRYEEQVQQESDERGTR